ncbi:MAG TPA: helix-turn-helix domain-containing protein [Pyrinomonadaceae bacterium]|nr:helix-turn-helix domain-containing protein [Pyrinomonadaceae bacterium]
MASFIGGVDEALASLDYTGGDKTRTARTLRIGRKTLYRKLLDYRNDDPAA